MNATLILAVFTLGALVFSSARGATYTFTNLLNSSGDFALFYHCAAINNSGVVAFHAERDSGVKGIYRTDGTTVTTIVDDSTNEFSFHPVPRSLESRPAIDDTGTVAFFIYHRVGDWDYAPSVRTGNGGATTLIAESSTTGTFYDAFSNPAIRNGVVSFCGGLNAPPSDPHGAFTAPSSGGSYTVVAQQGGEFGDSFSETSINAGGQVAFWAVLTNSPEGIFVGPGGATTIATTEAGSPFTRLFEFPKISDSGTVVFFAQLTNGNYGVFYGSGGALTEVTVAGGGELDDTFPSINSAGTVACLGRLASNERAILAGSGGTVEKVIAVGDPLFGSTVIQLDEPGSHGLNNNGQIVFGYSLENGVEGIAIATPASGGGVLNAELGLRFDAQYSDEGVYYNLFTLSLTNTGTVTIFALFIAPNQEAGFASRGTMDPMLTDAWDGWSVAMYQNGWYMLNSGDQYITNLSDVPNAAGWQYGQGLGVFWNTTHDPVTHQTTNALAPGSTLASFMQYGIGGFAPGQTNLPPLTYMVAGFDGAQVMTKIVTWSPPAPTPITLSAPTWLGGNQFRFTLTSAPGAVLEIWRSTNLNTWSSAGFVTNSTGTATFTDAAATTTHKFYRAQQQ
jgi:hypothetical protein